VLPAQMVTQVGGLRHGVVPSGGNVGRDRFTALIGRDPDGMPYGTL
jgi:hypothetical protein